MAIGLTLKDDEIHVYVMDTVIDPDDPDNVLKLDMLRETGVRVFSNNSDNAFDILATEAVARNLVHYDAVISY